MESAERSPAVPSKESPCRSSNHARAASTSSNTARLDRDNHETLYAYAAFVEEESDYIVNQLVETVLAKDKEFVAWRGASAVVRATACGEDPATEPAFHTRFEQVRGRVVI